ncbi:succinate dehydrogenase, hydrophobic membrane anchor protein [Abyssibacter profundi]|uniref:Succinate dehydrogenase hydrophobic membrane anchor subunit n=1 Tax=Abyssibacter profundi TaxID=2182787 RepID=A0A363UKB8_9GAMM|nr:succinate dehydrogenase, hydrophobic membrane anchor protein [Abyssibacter profundi]MBV60561.1 succinate dehydrogenase, hydrophobic membrane anchor protein [Nevskiales bacterium]PWN55872.1 succinate dehydrogenase, hydrophobic membrane anchor protein [Abyssibacter profundi]
MSLQSPIGRARGLGSAKQGLHHWWMQRITAVLLVPLTLWFVFSVASLIGGGYEATVAWVSAPWVAVALVIYFATLFYHAQLGVQVVIEDYIHGPTTKLVSMYLMKLAHLVLAVAAIFAVVRIALG